MLIHFRVAGQSRVEWFLTSAKRIGHVMSFVKVHRLQILTVLSLYRCWGLPVPVETLRYRGEGTHSAASPYAAATPARTATGSKY